jgi:hypothetical protein
MDVASFTRSLVKAFSDLPFAEDVDLRTEAFVVKGRVHLREERFVQIYFNERTGTIAFALIEEGRRVWGMDHDALRGWHEHPLSAPETHRNVKAKTVAEIVQALQEVWGELP